MPRIPARGAAVAERTTEERLTHTLGVVVATRPDGKACEIVGVAQEAMDLISTRPAPMTWSPQAVIETALADIQSRKAGWRRGDLTGRSTPRCLTTSPEVAVLRHADLRVSELVAGPARGHSRVVEEARHGLDEATPEPRRGAMSVPGR